MMADTDAPTLESLKPAAIWRFFYKLAAVPRPSKDEARICAEMCSMAKELGFSARQDGAGNIVIDVPATPGLESSPITVLQAHLDMVCEQNADTGHDFENDGIELIAEREAGSGETIVRANGTTLGADNGIGVAMALAAATDPDVKHGPLELLFTTDEESGMTGAMALTPQSIRGRRMLNLDAEEDDVLYIGCAGGIDATLKFDLEAGKVEPSNSAWRVAVSGLRGGHSGADIHQGRANAIKLLARTLCAVDADPLRIASINGGQLRNAIPREASAVVVGPSQLGDALRQAARTVLDEAVKEHGDVDTMIELVDLSPGEATSALSLADTQRVLGTLTALPHGVLGVDADIVGLVETSNNVATVQTQPGGEPGRLRVSIGNLVRSSSEMRKQVAVAQIAAVARLCKASLSTGNDYPGWKPNIKSPLSDLCRTVYERLFSAQPTVTAIHAGVECGIIQKHVGEMDMISLGPRIEGAHSPDERVYVDSVQKSWKFFVAILAEMAG